MKSHIWKRQFCLIRRHQNKKNKKGETSPALYVHFKNKCHTGHIRVTYVFILYKKENRVPDLQVYNQSACLTCVHNLILVFLLTALCCVTYTPYFSTHMWVIVFRAEFVQIQQWLVHALLELQGTFKSLDTAAPLIPVWLLQLKHHKKKTNPKTSETFINER